LGTFKNQFRLDYQRRTQQRLSVVGLSNTKSTRLVLASLTNTNLEDEIEKENFDEHPRKKEKVDEENSFCCCFGRRNKVTDVDSLDMTREKMKNNASLKQTNEEEEERFEDIVERSRRQSGRVSFSDSHEENNRRQSEVSLESFPGV